MDLQLYVESIHRQLAVAAQAGGDEARALAERLVAPLDAAIRLTLQDLLAAAAEEITCELAPGSVELRLRGRELELLVTRPPADTPEDELPESERYEEPYGWAVGGTRVRAPTCAQAGEGGMSRINLRMADRLKARIEHAAGSDGLSVNAWLVRAAAVTLERGDFGPRRERRAAQGAQRYTGWAR